MTFALLPAAVFVQEAEAASSVKIPATWLYKFKDQVSQNGMSQTYAAALWRSWSGGSGTLDSSLSKLAAERAVECALYSKWGSTERPSGSTSISPAGAECVYYGGSLPNCNEFMDYLFNYGVTSNSGNFTSSTYKNGSMGIALVQVGDCVWGVAEFKNTAGDNKIWSPSTGAVTDGSSIPSTYAYTATVSADSSKMSFPDVSKQTLSVAVGASASVTVSAPTGQNTAAGTYYPVDRSSISWSASSSAATYTWNASTGALSVSGASAGTCTLTGSVAGKTCATVTVTVGGGAAAKTDISKATVNLNSGGTLTYNGAARDTVSSVTYGG